MKLKHYAFLLLFFGGSMVMPTRAQHPDFDVPDWAIGKFYSVSKEAPLTSHMAKSSKFLTTSRKIIQFIEETESNLLGVLSSNLPPKETQTFRPCNNDGRGFKRSLKAGFGMRGQAAPDIGCITDLEDTSFFSDKKPRFSVREIYDASFTRAQTVWQQRFKLIEAARSGWNGSEIIVEWSDPDVPRSFPVSRGSVNCILQGAGSMRVGATWYSRTIVTNQYQLKSVPEGERQFFHEFSRVTDDGKSAEPMPMILPRYKDNIPTYGATTAFTRFGGKAGIATYGSIREETNPAVLNAMDKADLGIQQVDDALTPSSLALLLLPLVLNMIPIALLTAATKRVMVVYTIMSDILSVVPLAIKGVELIVIGNQRYIAINTRLTSTTNGTRAATAAAEVWGAECRARGNTTPIGISFLTLALVFMVCGIAAEIWAYRFMKRRNQRERDRIETAARKALVLNFEHYDDEQYISSMSDGLSQREPKRLDKASLKQRNENVNNLNSFENM